MDNMNECISREEQIPAGPDTHRFEKLVKWLGLKDPQKNRAAVTLLSRLGRPGMELLVEEAAGPGKQPDHRVAILDVVARIGEPLGPTEFFTLQSMLRHKVPRVAEKAAEAKCRGKIRDFDAWGTTYHELAKGNKVKKGWKNYGTVRFPTTHDITPEFLEECVTVVRNLVAGGNHVKRPAASPRGAAVSPIVKAAVRLSTIRRKAPFRRSALNVGW